jgi:hypothetical protein
MWGLGNFTKEDLPKIMLTSFEYEITPVSPYLEGRGFS